MHQELIVVCERLSQYCGYFGLRECKAKLKNSILQRRASRAWACLARKECVFERDPVEKPFRSGDGDHWRRISRQPKSVVDVATRGCRGGNADHANADRS